jgi:HSP20 family protein
MIRKFSRKELNMLMRTDPFRDLDRLAQAVFGTPAQPAMMPMDAYRDGDTFVVRLDVPGIDPGSIDLTVERNVLTVHAERTRPDPQAERIAAEVSHGLFSRQLFLGDSLDVDHLTADYTDGVLTLRLPVAERAKPRRIEVQHTGGTRSVEAATS